MKIKLRIVAGLLTGMLTVVGTAGGDDKGKTFFSVNPPESNIQAMEEAGRIYWQKPEKVVERLNIRAGDVIADIGSGTGYFSVLFAHKTGKNGLVYAVDIDRYMVGYLEKRIVAEGLDNIKNILARPDDPLLPDASIDLAFLCNTYLFIDKRDQYLAKIQKLLNKDGRLAIVSYNKIESPEGPPMHIRVSRETTIQEAEKAGFRLDTEFFFLPYQHFLVFEKKTKPF